MKKWITWLPMLVALPVILFLGWQFSTDPNSTKSRNVGGQIPHFKLPDLYKNEIVTDKNIKGEWAVVNIWATWCSPCLKEHAVLMDISRLHDIPLYGIDFKDDSEAAKQWLADKGNPYTVVLVDEQGKSAFDWGVVGVPETLLIDPLGVIKHRFAGQLTHEVWETEFLPLIPEEPNL
jgi:cytochrome c biogenesis protein CcmG/thiol:disulfide interchange protein DsbE